MSVHSTFFVFFFFPLQGTSLSPMWIIHFNILGESLRFSDAEKKKKSKEQSVNRFRLLLDLEDFFFSFLYLIQKHDN